MYNTTDYYKSIIYNINHHLKVYINDTEIESKYILDCKPTNTLFTNGEIELGSTPSQTIELKLYKSVVPATINKVEIKSGITGEIVPLGVYNIDKAPTKDDYTVTLALSDNMTKFEFNYDGSTLINNNGGKAKIIQVLQDICSKAGVELGSTSFLNMNKEIAVYDNTVKARTYLSYISEQAGGFAFIGRDGKLYIKYFKYAPGKIIGQGNRIEIKNTNNLMAKVIVKGNTLQNKTESTPSLSNASDIITIGNNTNFLPTSPDGWERGSISSDGSLASSTTRIRTKNFIPINGLKTYYISINNSGYCVQNIIMYKEDGTAAGYWNTINSAISGTRGLKINFQSKEYIKIKVVLRNTTSNKSILPAEILNIKPKLEQYHIKTEFSEYTEGNTKIYENKTNLFNYETGLKTSISGLTNTLDEDGYITTTGEISSNYIHICEDDVTGKLVDGETYTMKHENNNKYVYLQMLARKRDGSGITYIGGTEKLKVTFKVDKKKYIKYELIVSSNTKTIWTATSRTIKDRYMLYKGNEDIEFEKCEEKKILLPIQKELAKVGKYQDCFVKKDNKRYERHYIKKAVFDGSEEGWSVYTQGNMSNYYNNSLLNFKTQEGISNYFKVSNDNSYSNTNTRLVIFNSKSGFGIYTKKSTFESLEAFKNKLSEWNEAGNPLCLYYVLENPEDIACTAEQTKILEELEKLEIFKNYSQINSDAGMQVNFTRAEMPFKYFQNFEWGARYKLSKVRYEDGIRVFEKGDDAGNTLYINPDNMFIVDQEQIDNIYDELKDLELYSFNGDSIVDPALDIGDIVVIDGKQVLYQGSSQYSGRWKASISSEIKSKERQETTAVKKPSQKTINRRVQSSIDQVNGKIEQLAEETTENTEKLTKHEQTIDSISDKVSNMADLTNSVTGNKTITLENCIEGDLLELNIKGNNTAFECLFLNDTLVLSDELYLKGDSEIIVTDEKGNSKIYELGIADVLRKNGEIYDEYILKEGKAKVIRRINADGSIKTTTTTENLENLSIELKSGINTISIKNYNAEISAKFAIKSEYSEIFASKVEMNSSIEQKADEIDISVNKKLENYSTTEETNSAIKLESDEISAEVIKKVGKEEFGTYVQQNYEAVKLAWNQISEFIQMMIINNNASFAILDNNKKVMMALDKTGQHFYKNDGSTIFGEMAVNKENNDSYISFAVEGEYNQDISNGMAWGIKTKSDQKFHPIFYIKNFHMSEKNSDSSYGELLLASCNLLFNGINTGIQSGNIKIYGDDANNSINFINTDTDELLLSISSEDLVTGNKKIDILDAISFYANSGGTNSFRIGNNDSKYVLLDDDGMFSVVGGDVKLGVPGKEVTFDLYVKTLASIHGNLDVNGEIFADNISSDRRIKKNIKNSNTCALDIIKKIKHKEFDKKSDGKHYKIGYIAQEMEKIDPNFVIIKSKTEATDERYYINELPIIATISKALQEQQEIIEKQQKIIEELQIKIQGLEEKING